MRDFMSHDSRHLIFLLRSHEQAGVDVKKAAGQSEGVDRWVINNFYRERDLEVGVPRHVLRHSVDILVDDRIFEQLCGTLDLSGVLFPDGNFLFL